MKNPFRYLGEGVAYMQAFLDDTILYSIKKLQSQADKERNPEDIKQIHKKVGYYIGKGLSASIGETFGGFYEKYADLKKGNNLAQMAIEQDLPKAVLRARHMKVKMEIMGVKKGDIQSIRKLKNQVSLKDKIRIKRKLMNVKNELKNFETIGNLEDIKNLKNLDNGYIKKKK